MFITYTVVAILFARTQQAGCSPKSNLHIEEVKCMVRKQQQLVLFPSEGTDRNGSFVTEWERLNTLACPIVPLPFSLERQDHRTKEFFSEASAL